MNPIASGTRATIFVNASSGWDSSADAPQRLERWFRDAGIDAQVEYVAKGVNLAEKAREAIAAGHRLVVAGGGDGTLSATASALAGTEAAFGILPIGTLNHFARDLGLPLDLEAAAGIICAGRTAEVDVGEVNNKTFLNNAVVGLYPIFRALRAEFERDGMHPKLAWLWGWAKTIWRMPFFRMRFYVEGREMVRRTPYVLIANNEHEMEGWRLGARRTLNEGRLWIYVLRPQSRFGLLWMGLKLIFGVFRRQQHFDVFSATELYVDTKSRRLAVSLDGEIHVMETPLHFRSLPRSLTVLVP